MLSKALALTSVAALAGQSLALNAHRRLHQHNDKRALEVVYETVWHTVYVSDSECTTCTEPALPTAGTSAAHAFKPVSTLSVTLTSTTSSTLTIQAPTLPATQAPAPSSPAAKPSSQQTTMITMVQSTPAPDLTTLFSTPVSTPSAAPPSSSAEAPSSSAPPTSSQPASSSSAPKPSPTPVAMGIMAQGVSKRGMAYNDPNLANAFGNLCPTCSWAYNWGSTSGALDARHKYIPMLWGPGADHSQGWAAAADQAIAAGADKILSFNEPDNAGQSNLSPGAAAAAHAQFMNPYQGKARIGAPAVTNSNLQNQGIDWLTQFMAACKAQPGGCAVDFCVVHWYSPAEAKATLFDHLEKAHQACDGKPIMLTEFAPFGDDVAIDAFLKDVIPQLEALSYLEGYSYFMVGTNSLMADGNSPSTFGRTYATL